MLMTSLSRSSAADAEALFSYVDHIDHYNGIILAGCVVIAEKRSAGDTGNVWPLLFPTEALYTPNKNKEKYDQKSCFWIHVF